jgi:hypothetical protein
VRFLRIGGLAVLAALTFAAPAAAQEEGVFIDPGSPSAKEYDIPLEAERRQADPGRDPGAGIQQGSRSSPIFGEGIVGDGDAAGATSSSAPSSAAKDRDRDAAEERDTAKEPAQKSAPQKSPEDDEVVRSATSNPGAPDGGTGVPLTIGGVAIGVLLVGGLIGLLLRRRASG